MIRFCHFSLSFLWFCLLVHKIAWKLSHSVIIECVVAAVAYLMNLLIVLLVEATPQPTSNELMKCKCLEIYFKDKFYLFFLIDISDDNKLPSLHRVWISGQLYHDHRRRLHRPQFRNDHDHLYDGCGSSRQHDQRCDRNWIGSLRRKISGSNWN